jgi:hypothetical protein
VELTNERKVFAGILGLALCALAVDRVILGHGGPRTAGAFEVAPGASPKPASARIQPASLAQKVAALGDSGEVQSEDAFALPDAMKPRQQSDGEAPHAAPLALRITAVSGVHGPRPVACINGRTLALDEPEPRSGMTLIGLRELNDEIEASVRMGDGSVASARFRVGTTDQARSGNAGEGPR